jgi:hypothetical protein
VLLQWCADHWERGKNGKKGRNRGTVKKKNADNKRKRDVLEKTGKKIQRKIEEGEQEDMQKKEETEHV